jgi:hypothetical protein
VLLVGPRLTQAETPIFSDQTQASGLEFVHFNGMSGELYFPEVFGPGNALFDFDGDGDLDVYLVQGNMLGDDKSVKDAVLAPPGPLPLSDRLLRNDVVVTGDGGVEVRFVDVTEAAGIAATGYGMGVATGDYDNDGWIDLYVTNFGSNSLLHNNGDGTFTDVTKETGTDDRRWSVPAIFFDYDQDGWLDLYVGNFVEFRMATHKKCSSSSGASDYCAPIVYEPETDRLFRNRGDGTFENVSKSSGIEQEYGGALGVVGADFNGDRWLDLYVANDGMANQLWMNQGDGTFINDAVLGGTAVNEQGLPEASMGVVAGDFNGDGTTDLFLSHLAEETNTFYLNDGSGLFREATRDSGLGPPSWQYTGFGTALSDYDNDSWLDLMVVNGAVKRIEPQARAGEAHPLRQKNQLFRNLGSGRFEEVTSAAGAAFEVEEVSRGLASGDIDNDGDPDFLITNNGGAARLLINEIGQQAPWLGVRMMDPALGRDIQGARFVVHRAGEERLHRRLSTDGSYASSNDPRTTVGLASSSTDPSVEITWPSGATQRWTNLPLNKYVILTAPGRRSGR